MVVRAGANVNARTLNGWTVLMKATLWGRTGVVEVLLQHGAEISATNADGWTALDIAIEKGHREIIRLLLDAGNRTTDFADSHRKEPSV